MVLPPYDVEVLRCGIMPTNLYLWMCMYRKTYMYAWMNGYRQNCINVCTHVHTYTDIYNMVFSVQDLSDKLLEPLWDMGLMGIISM